VKVGKDRGVSTKIRSERGEVLHLDPSICLIVGPILHRERDQDADDDYRELGGSTK
jgi:hypothetical protein